jgi:integrase
MKAGKAHTVPLSDRAVEILRHLGSNTTKVATGFVFLNGFGKPISNMAMAELVKGMGATCTVHGFRSTFSDWAHDRTGYAPDVIEPYHQEQDRRRLPSRHCPREARAVDGGLGAVLW